MNYSELQNLIAKTVGLRLTVIGYACNMPMFNFENDDVSYALHAQCLTRITRNDDVLVTTHDYQSWDGEREENNDFLYNLKRFKPQIEGGVVVSVEVNSLFDVVIKLDNGVIIQVLIDNGYSHYDEESEQYRFFELTPDDEESDEDNLPPHYVVYGKHIEIHD